MDHAGHANGFSPDVAPYTSAIEGVDSYLEIVFDGIRSRQTYSDEDWLIIITTDHGGTGFSHGGNSSEEEIIFFIVHHPIIESALIEKDSSYVINENANCLAQTEVLSFDGSNDFIEIADNPLLPFDINQDFTVEFQIKTDEAADVAILGNKDWTTGANQGFVFSFEYPFGPAWKINISDGDTRIDLESGGAIADNQWHHLAASFDRDGYVKMYEDGVLLDSANISGLGDINTGLGLFIGADVDSDFDFQGYVSDVRIWNTILEESTISQWQCMPLAQDHPNNANLIAHYPLDASNAAQSNLISDASPNALDGILEGAMWESSDSSLVYSYQSTPRLTDVVPTVLEHLCIQENEAWALDGKSWIEEYFENINPRRVHPSIFLEGAYLGDGLMSTNLTAQIPLTHPYGNAPYNYGGSETLTVVPTTMVDWVLVELRSGIPSLSGARTTTTEETQAAILMSNGEIVDVQGDPLIFQNVQTGTDYHLCIRHRNHLDVLSAYAVTGTNDMYFDFTDNLAQAYGEEQLKIHGDGSALMLAGEFNQDAVIQNTDYNAWKLNPAQTNVYRKTDANLDGTVQTTDFDWWTINKAKIGHPEAGF